MPRPHRVVSGPLGPVRAAPASGARRSPRPAPGGDGTGRRDGATGRGDGDGARSGVSYRSAARTARECTTATGQVAWCRTPWLTEPSIAATRAWREWLPTTSRSWAVEAATRAATG